MCQRHDLGKEEGPTLRNWDMPSTANLRKCCPLRLARRLRMTLTMSIELFRIPRCTLLLIMATTMTTALGCNRYPSAPREVVIEFVKATQSEKSDAKAYLSTSFKSKYSGKGFKYTFAEAEVLQSAPQASGHSVVLVKNVRLGGGGVVTATNMRVNAIRENARWVISGLVAGLTEAGGSGNDNWQSADGISLY